METLFIADDEKNIREGLKCILEWETLGFALCGEAANGEETLSGILQKNPSLVLLDIRMPKLTGIDIVRIAREQGYRGRFIILSGYSDFSYAQAAIRYGVEYYLTKPIDEDELEQSVRTVHDLIEKESRASRSYSQYRDRARDNILRDILLNTCDCRALDLQDLDLQAGIYQVITYGNYNQDTFYQEWNFPT